MNNIPSLNGLRAVSIIMVFLFHLNISYLHIQNKIFAYLSDGLFAVNMFFVISGFLITSLLLNEENKTGTISLKGFYYRRTLRIFPAYYFMLLVYAILPIHIPWSGWVTSLTYTRFLGPGGETDHYTAHGWSLSIEEQFYLFWPIIFLNFKKYRTAILVLIIAFVPVMKVVLYYFPGFNWIYNLPIMYRADAIALGCLVALHKERIKITGRVMGAVVILLLLLPYIGTEWNIKYHLHIGFLVTAFGTTYGTAANICIAAIILYSIRQKDTYWFAFLNTKVMNQIGVWSYSIYLWHILFLSNNGEWYTIFPYNIGFAFAAATISYYLIERPFLRLKNRPVILGKLKPVV